MEFACPMSIRALVSPLSSSMARSRTAAQFRLINDAITSCVPKAQRVVLKSVTHDAPVHDPASFSSAILDFLAKRPGL